MRKINLGLSGGIIPNLDKRLIESVVGASNEKEIADLISKILTIRESQPEFGVFYFAYRDSTKASSKTWYRIDIIRCAVIINFFTRFNLSNPRYPIQSSEVLNEQSLINYLYHLSGIYCPHEPTYDGSLGNISQGYHRIISSLNNVLLNDGADDATKAAKVLAIDEEVSRRLADAKYTVFQMSNDWCYNSTHDYENDPGYLMAVVGLSASGKTTLALKLFRDFHFIIMDEPNTNLDISMAYAALHGYRDDMHHVRMIHRVHTMSDGLVLSMVLSLVSKGCILDSVSLMSRKGVEAAKAHLTNEFPQWLASLSSFLRYSGCKSVYLWNEYAADDSIRDEIRARTMASTTTYIIINDFYSAELSSRVRLALPGLAHSGDRSFIKFNPSVIITSKDNGDKKSGQIEPEIHFQPTAYADPDKWSNPISKLAISSPNSRRLIDDTNNLPEDSHQLEISSDNLSDLSKIFSI